MRKKKFIEPFEMDVLTLGRGGVGVGVAPDGAPVQVRFAPPGARVRVVAQGKRHGVWSARRTDLVSPPLEAAKPACPVFSLCGGCALQELDLAAQRRAKQEFALQELGAAFAEGVRVHPIRGPGAAYGYRNRVELSFGTARYVSEADREASAPIDGRWLGFHAPGRFDRVVDTEACALVGAGANAVIATARRIALDPEAPPPWNARDHTGFWRHLMVRESTLGEILVGVYTAPANEAEAEWVERLATALLSVSGGSSRVVGVVWIENAGVADVAQGAVRQHWGADQFHERLGAVRYRLGLTSFFQTSTEGAVVLYDTIGEAVGDAAARRGTLYDLYCGIGSIGLYLADRFDAVIGLEEHAGAVEDARRNAAENGVNHATYHAAKVEDALDRLPERESGPRTLIVDPPRAGLHPKVAAALGRAEADVLVYVACHPGSLGRDAAVLIAGGWVPTDLWTVDLFPQTGHVEAVARFVRPSV